VALGEALTPEFQEMNAQIVKNAQKLASELESKGFEIATG
jgi:glycine/serine hydroxymethyltransferase